VQPRHLRSLDVAAMPKLFETHRPLAATAPARSTRYGVAMEKLATPDEVLA
jgi:hypothetical protein